MIINQSNRYQTLSLYYTNKQHLRGRHTQSETHTTAKRMRC